MGSFTIHFKTHGGLGGLILRTYNLKLGFLPRTHLIPCLIYPENGRCDLTGGCGGQLYFCCHFFDESAIAVTMKLSWHGYSADTVYVEEGQGAGSAKGMQGMPLPSRTPPLLHASSRDQAEDWVCAPPQASTLLNRKVMEEHWGQQM